MRRLNVEIVVVALLVARVAVAGNQPPPDPITGKIGDTVGQSFDPNTGKWVTSGSVQGAPSAGPAPEFHGWRDRAIWNSAEISGLYLAPEGTAPISEYAGAIAYDVFTTPEVSESLELVAHGRIGGGYSAEGNGMFDLILALGAGVQFGPVSVMALAALDYDSIWGHNGATLHEPLSLGWGPEVRVQLWPVEWGSLDLDAARFYKLTGSLPNGDDVPTETRLSAMLSLVPGGRGLGVSFGAQYTDYGLGSATMAIAAVRWGSR
jgi:hypothetical protein